MTTVVKRVQVTWKMVYKNQIVAKGADQRKVAEKREKAAEAVQASVLMNTILSNGTHQTDEEERCVP